MPPGGGYQTSLSDRIRSMGERDFRRLPLAALKKMHKEIDEIGEPQHVRDLFGSETFLAGYQMMCKIMKEKEEEEAEMAKQNVQNVKELALMAPPKNFEELKEAALTAHTDNIKSIATKQAESAYEDWQKHTWVMKSLKGTEVLSGISSLLATICTLGVFPLLSYIMWRTRTKPRKIQAYVASCLPQQVNVSEVVKDYLVASSSATKNALIGEKSEFGRKLDELSKTREKARAAEERMKACLKSDPEAVYLGKAMDKLAEKTAQLDIRLEQMRIFSAKVNAVFDEEAARLKADDSRIVHRALLEEVAELCEGINDIVREADKTMFRTAVELCERANILRQEVRLFLQDNNTHIALTEAGEARVEDLEKIGEAIAAGDDTKKADNGAEQLCVEAEAIVANL